jgi:hypothetical protein
MCELPLYREEWYRGITLAEIERRLRADGHSQDEIDLSLAFVITVREELALRGKWPPRREQRPS